MLIEIRVYVIDDPTQLPWRESSLPTRLLLRLCVGVQNVGKGGERQVLGFPAADGVGVIIRQGSQAAADVLKPTVRFASSWKAPAHGLAHAEYLSEVRANGQLNKWEAKRMFRRREADLQLARVAGRDDSNAAAWGRSRIPYEAIHPQRLVRGWRQ